MGGTVTEYTVEHLEVYETHLGCKVIERLRVFSDTTHLDVVLIGQEARLSIAPDWVRERGKVWHG